MPPTPWGSTEPLPRLTLPAGCRLATAAQAAKPQWPRDSVPGSEGLHETAALPGPGPPTSLSRISLARSLMSCEGLTCSGSSSSCSAKAYRTARSGSVLSCRVWAPRPSTPSRPHPLHPLPSTGAQAGSAPVVPDVGPLSHEGVPHLSTQGPPAPRGPGEGRHGVGWLHGSSRGQHTPAHAVPARKLCSRSPKVSPGTLPVEALSPGEGEVAKHQEWGGVATLPPTQGRSPGHVAGGVGRDTDPYLGLKARGHVCGFRTVLGEHKLSHLPT